MKRRKKTVRKQSELKRSIPYLFQFIVQVSLSQFPRAPTKIAPILFVIFVIVFAFGINSIMTSTESASLSFQVFVVISRTEFFVIR